LIVTNFQDENIFEEMLLALRNGGTMIFTTKFSYFGFYWHTDVLEKLEKQGRIQAIESEEFFEFWKMK